MTSPQTTAPEAARRELTQRRLIGAAAIAFAVLVIVENVLFAITDAPAYSDPIEVVLAYYASTGTEIAVVAGMMAAYLTLLLLFVTGLHGIVERRGSAGSDWSRLAVAGGTTVSAIFVLVNVLQIGLVLSARDLVEPTSAFEIIWQIHAAAFALTLPMLGITSIGTALAAHASGLTPAWQRILGLAGGGLLLAAGLGNFAIAEGSMLIVVGLLGFAAWLAWLLVTGTRLVRSREIPREKAPTR